MALVKTIANPLGPGTIEAYAKYTRFSIDVEEQTVRLELAVYQSQEARDTLDEDGNQVYPPILREHYTTTRDGASGPDGPIGGAPDFAAYQAGDNADPDGVGSMIYTFLKVFTRWAGATDA